MATFNGSSKADTYYGTDKNDVIYGKGGSDALGGGKGDDTIDAGSGNDFILLSAGKDKVDGGTGTDIFSLQDATSGVTLDLGLGKVSFQTKLGSGVTTFKNVEYVLGSRFNDNLTGDSQNNIILADRGNDKSHGGGGSDLMDGGAGDDKIYGDAGDDYLFYGGGKDSFSGGTGVDMLVFFGLTKGLTLDLSSSAGADVELLKVKNHITYTGMEDVIGTNFADKLTGNSADNWFYGIDGSDMLKGAGGADTFVFENLPGKGTAAVTDFKPGTDHIGLSTFTMTNLTGDGFFERRGSFIDYATLTKDSFHSSSSGQAHDASDRIIYELDTGSIWYDADGNKSGDRALIGMVSSFLDLHASDFYVLQFNIGFLQDVFS